MNLSEEQLRLLFLSVINEYANTYDDKKAIDYGVERFYTILKEQEQNRNTNSPILPTERQVEKHTPDSRGNMERYTNEYYFDNQKEIGEL